MPRRGASRLSHWSLFTRCRYAAKVFGRNCSTLAASGQPRVNRGEVDNYSSFLASGQGSRGKVQIQSTRRLSSRPLLYLHSIPSWRAGLL